jgi:hypothetical protein
VGGFGKKEKEGERDRAKVRRGN